MAFINGNEILFSANINMGEHANGVISVITITDIDTVYDSIDSLPKTNVTHGTSYLVINDTENVVCVFNGDALKWEKTHDMQPNYAYIVLKGNGAGVYYYKTTSPYLVRVDKREIEVIHTIDDIYDSVDNLPTGLTVASDQKLLVVNEHEQAIYKFERNAWLIGSWSKYADLQYEIVYIVLHGKKAGIYRYTNSYPYLTLIEDETSDGTNGLEYELGDDCTYYTLTGIGDVTDTDITIPSTYRGLPVKKIGNGAFKDCEHIASITIPDSVTSIGDDAFRDCTSLTSIEIPDSVTSIGVYAFCNCDSLTSVVIGEGVTSIGSSAFSNCTSLTSVNIPNGVKIIPNTAFAYCSSLTSVKLPDSITNIEVVAFNGCTNLTSIVIPDSVTSIGSSAFYNCTSLTSVVIGDSVTSIGYTAFSGCINLSKLIIGNSVETIGNYAFARCEKLTNITIPNSVTSIGNNAFAGCKNLVSISIPNSVNIIDVEAFSLCVKLTIYCEATSKPANWHTRWNSDARPVVWGVALDFPKVADKINEATSEAVNKSVAHTLSTIKQGSANLFNPKSPDIYVGGYLLNTGEIQSSPSYFISHKIPASNGDIYMVRRSTNISPSLMGGIYDINDNFLSQIIVELDDSGEIGTFTILNAKAAYIRVNGDKFIRNTLMVVKGTEYPSEYIPFWASLTEDFSLNEKQTEEVKGVIASESQVKYFRSANLFDYNDTEDGYYLHPSTGEKTAHSLNSISYIRLDGLGTYTTKVNTGLFGLAMGKKFAVFDKDKNFIGACTGVLAEEVQGDAVGVTITIDIEGAYYVGFTVLTSLKQDIMFVKGTEYPTEHIAFDEYNYIDNLRVEPSADTQLNPLHGKKISLNGDSICAGAGFSGGYGLIIAERNGMRYQNIARGGGTITAEQYGSDGTARHWISRTIANMDADADYAIVEGGVNDASIGVSMGTITANYKTAHFNFDETTFYGAFESMLKQLIVRFAGKKIGYIFVHKMTDYFCSDNADDGSSYYWAAKKCCEKWGVPFLDLNTTVPPFAYFKYNTTDDLKQMVTTYTYNGDGWHPNEEGYKKYYCDKIEAWLKTL